MCRRSHATAKNRGRWIVGQRGSIVWGYYFGGKPSLRRVLLTDKGSTLWTSKHDLELMVKKMARKVDAAKIQGEDDLDGVSGGEMFLAFKQLMSWLCDPRYEDGSKKGKVRIQGERRGKRFVWTLKNADAGTYLECGHETVQDALLTMELLLSSDDCPWIHDPYPIKNPEQKRKK